MVAFIILVPMIYALQRKTKKSILLYGIPLLAGLAITHTFIPPTPGPVAVADILKSRFGLGYFIWIYCRDTYRHYMWTCFRKIYFKTYYYFWYTYT